MSAITTRKTKTSGTVITEQVEKPINFRAYNATIGAVKDVVNLHINYIVPLGKKFTWLSGQGTSNSNTIWQVKIDGVLWLRKRGTYHVPNVVLYPEAPLVLTAGQNVQIEAINKSILSLNSEIETWFFGNEETA